MGEGIAGRDLVVCASAFDRPDPAVVVAAARVGALGVLDLGTDGSRGAAALEQVLADAPAPIGIRLPFGCPVDADDVLGVLEAASACTRTPTPIETVVVADPAMVRAWSGRGWRVLAEVRSIGEARTALADGADGLIARGGESGGHVGEETTFVLLSRLIGALDVPVWAAGGIGMHSASGAIAAGARGVVLDAQLTLCKESTIPDAVRDAVRGMDGSETVVVGGVRVFCRPDLAAATLGAEDPAPSPLGADDLHAQYLPVGQDGAFAAGFAERWPTVGSAVVGLRRQIASHLESARRLDPLAPGAPLAATHGTRYPIAQGPMTRVSDRAAFAAEVARAGALPFLALAVMPGDEVRTLLEETAALLGDRPWGVGILGFVPPEVREEQLRAVHDVRPPVALIAGGRPSQARPLEEVGIATYLHVPSPGLLARFVKDGARRFVFEGRECGGHVGPRSSFALWDAQVETLLGSGVAGETSVLFAGGIHDARSAAVVATVGAPLAEAGARIGVLMGSAYLFTEEAVRSGAIVAGFQQAALACDETVLLETSPGHATRCAETDYVRAFREERRRLEAAGADAKEAWAALELFNLGRLRVASKGLAHSDAGLEAVGADDQRREGMYMLGQVAALRHETTTLAALHEDVCAGSSRVLAGLEDVADALARAVRPAAPARAEVAIVGMACVLPGAPDAESFWANVVGGVDSVTEVPAARWDAARYYDPEAFTRDAGRKTPSKWGGFLPEVAFDALSFGIPPRSLAAIEPVQLLALRVAADAMEDAGYGRTSARELDRSRISVVFGAEAGTDLASAYGFRALAGQYLGGLPEGLDAALPELTEDSFPGLLTNVIAGRIANRLDLGGVNYTVDAACASSLAAVDAAVKELVAGTSDMVLCGGADLHNGINDYLLFAAVHALSPSGRCASFDSSADGIALGEGVACVVLKRLADAERDGDRVYAVLEGIAGSSDGRSLGLTAPRPEGQRAAIERAYAQARVAPSAVGLVEAHGTGTVVGDRTELAVLTDVFAGSGAAPGTCTLGSVKSQIGHTKCTAGLAALIKTARALYHGVLPPTIHVSDPNPGYDPDGGPFALRAEACPWVDEHRIAGVSAFGFGGTNFHALLRAPGEGASVRAPGVGGSAGPGFGFERWPAELFCFRSPERHGVDAALGRLEEAVAGLPGGLGRAAVPSRMLRDLAATACGSGEGPVQVALVASDLDDLGAKLASARASLREGTAPAEGVFVAAATVAAADAPQGSPVVAFVFPGQGSQRPGMLADLFVAFPGLRHHLRTASRYADVLFPPTAYDAAHRKAQTAAITDTRVAQPTLGIADLALADLLGSLGVRPAMVAGHSYGELVALVVAGALRAEDLVELSSRRAEAILGAAGEDPGTMAAVAAGYDEVVAALGDDSGVVVGNDNAPGQVVLSGPTEALEKATARLGEAGLASKRIPVACAFHSPVVAAATTTLLGHLGDVVVEAPALPVWSNTTAEPYPDTPDEVRRLLADQVARPVRLREQIVAMHEAGARVFVEVGPGKVLSGLVGRILGGERPHEVIALDGSGKGDLPGLLRALARLAVTGVPLDTDALFVGRARTVDLDAPVPVPGWVINGHLVRTPDGAVVPGALLPADAIPRVASTERLGAGVVGSTAAPVSPTGAETAVVEYLRSMREMVAAGREVLLGYLGDPARHGVAPVAIDAPSTVAGASTAIAAEPGAPHVAHAGGGAAAAQRETLLHGEALRAAVLGIVSERTGYPLDMLDPTLDLEADLSIDSIKRLEIVGELAERVGLAVGEEGPDESLVEELVAVKTLDGIVAWLEETAARLGTEASRPAAPAVSLPADAHGDVAVPDEDRARDAGAPDVPPAALRFVPRLVRVEPPSAEGGATLRGRRVVLTDDGVGVARALSELLAGAGADVRVVAADEPLGTLDMLVHLDALGARVDLGALGLFQRTQEAIAAGARAVLTATATGGNLGMEEDVSANGHAPGSGIAAERFLRSAGMRGVVKTTAREHPEVAVRLVDVDPAFSAGEVATILLDELSAGDSHVEVGRTRLARSTVTVVPSVLAPTTNGARREGADAGADGLGIGPDAVVLITGGARGVTARVSEAIARQAGCTLVLVGRTPEPINPESTATAGCADALALRRTLAEGRFGAPAVIEAEVRRIMASREVRTNLAAMRAGGATVEYRQADLRNPDVVRELLADVYATYGRLDGIVHGAGVLEDGRLVDKSSDSFRRVFETKVAGALAVSGLIRPDFKFVVLFSSVSGVWGNRGQVDYAAANDALAGMARLIHGQVPGRVVAVDWGPWAGGGMVSPELEREFNRRGIGLLDPDDAVACLLEELRSDADDPEVIYMRAEPERFG